MHYSHTMTPTTSRTPNPDHCPISLPLPATLESKNGALLVSLAGVPGPDVVAAPDSVLVILEVTTSPRTVVEVKIVVVVSSDVEELEEDSDSEDEEDDEDDDEDDDESLVGVKVTVASLVTVDGSPETVVVFSIVIG